MVDRDDLSVVRCELVRAGTERLPQRTRQRDEKSAGGTRRRCGPSDRRLRSLVTGVPPLDRVDATVERQHPHAPEAHLEGDGRHLFVVAGHVRRGKPRVVRLRRQQVADTKVTGTQPFAPRHPGRSEQGVVTRKEDDLFDRHGLTARDAPERDGPVPAAIGRVERGEQVRGDAFVVGLDAEVLANQTGRGFLGCGTRFVYRVRHNGIDNGCHPDILSYISAQMCAEFGETGGVVNGVDEKRAEPAAVGSAFVQFLRAIVHAIRAGLRRLSAWNRSSGAGESGLARLVELHAWQAAGDAFVTVALAGSLFFSVPTHQARTRVALYLIVAMAPFALLAPLLGPLLDRFRHGRRFALAATMLARATLALVIGHALAGKHLSTTEALALYPAALGVLVAQKTYAIARSAAVPRLLPQGLTLVQANSRMTIVGIFTPAIGASIALLITKLVGHQGALRVAAAVYVVSTIYALRLPHWADGGAEVRAKEAHPRLGSAFKLGQTDSVIASALRSSAALRWLSGFLLFFGAFVVQEHSIGGLPKAVALSALAIGLGVGNLAGTLVGARLKQSPTMRLAAALLAITAFTTLFTAIDFGLLSIFVVAVVSSATASIAKLALDATIQKRVDDSVRTSTFARSETTMQLAWVIGGAVGILLPTKPVAIGFIVATAVLGAAVLVALGVSPKGKAQPAPAES